MGQLLLGDVFTREKELKNKPDQSHILERGYDMP